MRHAAPPIKGPRCPDHTVCFYNHKNTKGRDRSGPGSPNWLTPWPLTWPRSSHLPRTFSHRWPLTSALTGRRCAVFTRSRLTDHPHSAFSRQKGPDVIKDVLICACVSIIMISPPLRREEARAFFLWLCFTMHIAPFMVDWTLALLGHKPSLSVLWW